MLSHLLPDFTRFDFKGPVAYGDAVPLAALGWATLYAALYSAVVLGLGLALFERRDLT
jgi:hypothetical protein